MKTKQEIQSKLSEISIKIDTIYKEKKSKNMIDKDSEDLLNILQIREDILEWILENKEKHD